MIKPTLTIVAALLTFPVAAQSAPAVMPIVDHGETMLLVEASGAQKVRPDRLSFAIGVQTVGKTAAEALNANSQRMSSVIAVLARFDIVDDRVQTNEFEIEPIFSDGRRSGATETITGYRATNTVNAEMRDFAKASDLIAAAFEAGANSVQGPGFDVDELVGKAAIRKAELAALAEGRAQADAMAAAVGMRVSRVLRISDRELDFDRGVRSNNGMIVVTGSRITGPPIEAGEIKVGVELFIEYALVPIG